MSVCVVMIQNNKAVCCELPLHTMDRGSSGANIQLRGMSMFWSQWSGNYWNADVVNWLASDFQVSLIRAAMGVEEGCSYLCSPAAEKAKMIAVVNASIAAGIYVMIDWHAHYAEESVPQARAFFDEMARTYGSYPNVLWETYNEPKQQDWGSVIKPYHEQIVPVIRAHSQNIITLGTRFWSQEVDVACSNPVAGSNLAYTIHFYAQIHKGELRSKVQTALNRGCAIFCSEWGTGFDFLDLGSAQEWLNFFGPLAISSANWGVYDKAGEENAALTAGASSTGGWSDSELTQSGKWVRNYIRGGGGSPSPPPGGGGCCKFGADCGDCGDDGTGWCHQTASNCDVCTGTFDSSAPAPSCNGGGNPSPSPSPSPPPTPPSPPPTPPSSGGQCCYGAGCSSCNGEGEWCSSSASACGSCGGSYCSR